MPKWPRRRRAGDAGLPADSHRWPLRQAAHPCGTTPHALPSSAVTNWTAASPGGRSTATTPDGWLSWPAARGSGRARVGHRTRSAPPPSPQAVVCEMAAIHRGVEPGDMARTVLGRDQGEPVLHGVLPAEAEQLGPRARPGRTRRLARLPRPQGVPLRTAQVGGHSAARRRPGVRTRLSSACWLVYCSSSSRPWPRCSRKSQPLSSGVPRRERSARHHPA